MDGMDLIVIDSFQAMDKGTLDERAAIEKLIQHAKVTECAVIIICHLTKGGVMRGSNHLTYAVDVNMFVEMGESADFRRIYFSKNRFGPGIDYVCSFTSRGYDFTAVTATAEDGDKKSKKADRKEKSKEEILKLNGQFSVTEVCTELEMDATRASYLLRELTLEGKLKNNKKRGLKARWSVNKIEATITKH
jgi:predicted ATP-dependent serine protease